MVSLRNWRMVFEKKYLSFLLRKYILFQNIKVYRWNCIQNWERKKLQSFLKKFFLKTTNEQTNCRFSQVSSEADQLKRTEISSILSSLQNQPNNASKFLGNLKQFFQRINFVIFCTKKKTILGKFKTFASEFSWSIYKNLPKIRAIYNWFFFRSSFAQQRQMCSIFFCVHITNFNLTRITHPIILINCRWFNVFSSACE